MSVYRCNSCGNYIDSDYDGCVLDPTDDCELICEGCHEEMDYKFELAYEACAVEGE